MWGQLATKLVRIGTLPGEEPEGSTFKELSPEEKHWKSAAEYLLTLSPDVGTSTNISPAMNQRVYGPDGTPDIEDELDVKYKHPELYASDDPWTRHIRFEIAEANCMSAVAAFGKMAHYTGLPFFPIMTVYDFFIKRALDQLYYNLYWGSGVRDHRHAERRHALVGGRATQLEVRYPDPEPDHVGSRSSRSKWTGSSATPSSAT